MKEVLKKEFNTPDFIYIPHDKSIKKTIGDNIYYEEIIGLRDRDYIISPVSGIVVKEEDVQGINNIQKSIVVENDFKEKRKKSYPSYRSIYNLKKDEISDILKSYNVELPKIINLRVYYKKGISSDSIMFCEYIEEILELLDVFNTSFKKEINICVKGRDKNSLFALQNYKETYPDIKVVYDNKKDKEYISVFDIYKIYFILKSKKLPVSKYVSIVTKDKIYNVKTKLYVKVDDLLKYVDISKSKNIILKTQNKEIEKYKGIIDENTIGIIVK